MRDMSSPAPQISLVIPAWNEAALLPRLLDSVDAAIARHGAGRVEVIVADNGSTDATAQLAAARGCVVVPVEKRVIAAARNGGAAAARGAIVCFVDADARIHPETFIEIERQLAQPKVIAGATGVTLERWSFGLVCTWLAFIPWVALLRIDTGVVFCRRADFVALGGYDESRLIAEDVDFLWRMRARGRARGQHLVRATRAKAIASTRKFDKYGDWHYFTQMPRLLRVWLRDRSVRTEFVRKYWYDDR